MNRDNYRHTERWYSKTAERTYRYFTLAFITQIQWERLQSPQRNGRRSGNSPLPPRNYCAWPIFETRSTK